MNYNLLKKILDELQKDNFRKDYIVGILETMIEQENKPNVLPIVNTNNIGSKNDAEILDALGKAQLNKLQL